MYNLLTEPLIRHIDREGQEHPASLPQTMHRLMQDQVETFPALRAHQTHPWHAFLVQLGAIAMHRAGTQELPDSAQEWETIIRRLTPDHPGDEPWHLAVENSAAPAFMQPPCHPGGDAGDQDKTASTPTEIDVLVTSKNHEVKQSPGLEHQPQDWMNALITIQTMGGNLGAGNLGISRMNSGLGSRPCFSPGPGRTQARTPRPKGHPGPPPGPGLDGRAASPDQRRHRPHLAHPLGRAGRRGPRAKPAGPLLHRGVPQNPPGHPPQRSSPGQPGHVQDHPGQQRATPGSDRRPLDPGQRPAGPAPPHPDRGRIPLPARRQYLLDEQWNRPSLLWPTPGNSSPGNPCS